MKRAELVYNYMLQAVLEKKQRKMTQAEIARALGVSLSTVNMSVSRLEDMNAVKVGKRSLEIIDPKKILYIWASVRNLQKDIIYTTRYDGTVSEIEKRMPPSVVYAAYSAYKMKFKDVPADYSEVYVYGGEDVINRFPAAKGPPNVFVLKKDVDEMTIVNIFVDLWNLKEWYAKDFLNALEGRIDGILA